MVIALGHPGAATTPDPLSPVYPERNTGAWDITTSESWQFVPESMSTPDYAFSWIDETGSVIGTDPLGVEVCPSTSTYYTGIMIIEDASMGIFEPISFSSTINVNIENLSNNETLLQDGDLFNIQTNPVKDNLVLNLKEDTNNLKIIISNSNGQIIMNQSLTSTNGIIDIHINDYESGVYFIKAVNTDNTTQNTQFIKE